ncbi:TRAP transporter large permease subunit [Pseudovibrio sp. Tun.PSC04-5.I4]|uniref:TRAP transporter large permease subunit n=1 Tax=Pseudovibrio sp. Tun.PSC04-5.I4 TaxID=1798213 RepID=UPI00087E0187|nr:TRAP transporter large permease subunit [Pseudovibrio sp. Tun.PSC04-5.I4]SDR48550.1 TRAP transporter, DctM subunit [Pseudovibrio sp. Tun.PSC04-5.I4]
MTLAIFLGVLLVGILLGLPVAFSLLLSALALMVNMGMFSSGLLMPSDILASALVNGVDSFALLAIPFFLVAGETMASGGLSRRIVRLAMACIGHKKGGLGYVAIFTSVVLAGLSGSAAADAAALVAILLPMMRGAGYPESRSAGLLAAGGIIAPVIPPSVPLILVGVAGNISISRLFMGGIAPGLMMGGALMMTWSYLMRDEETTLHEKATKKERNDAFKDGIWALILPFIIIIGIRFGIFTPTEAAVVAAVYAIFVSSVVYGELTLAKFYEVLVNSCKSAGMIMFLVGCAMVASWLITAAQLPQQLAAMLGPLIESPRLLMLVIMLLVLAIGMVMDLSPTILILVPLLMPIIREAGIDPAYFGLMFVMNCCIGLITPPVGTVLNVVCGVGRLKVEKAIVGVMPFVGVYAVLLMLFTVFPDLIIVPMNLIAG